MDRVIAELESIPPGPDDPDYEPDSDSDSLEKAEEVPAPGAALDYEPDDK